MRNTLYGPLFKVALALSVVLILPQNTRAQEDTDTSRSLQKKNNNAGQYAVRNGLTKQKLSRKPHLDSWHGIRFHPPEAWRGIPPARQRFGDMDHSEVNYSGQNIRITRYTSPYLENIYMMVFKLYDTRSQGQLEDRVLRSISENYPGLVQDSRKMMKTRYHTATRRTFQDSKGNRLVFYHYFGQKKGFTLVGIWRGGKSGVNKVDWENALPVFDQSAKSFWILPQSQQSAAKRATRNGSGTLMPGWKIKKTSHYTIEYSTRDEYANRLAKHIEKIRALYRKVIRSGKGIPKCHIKLFDNKEDFLYYGQIEGAAGYWSPAQEEMVAYRFSGEKLKLHNEEMTVTSDRDPEEETFHVMNHEGFHQYMYYLMGRQRGVEIPSWLNEGMGDYFFGGNWQKVKGRKVFKISTNWWRLDTIIKALEEGTHVPLKDLFNYSQEDYYANPGLCYAEGWAICYFFLTSPVAKKRGYNTIPQKMIQALQTTGDREKATKKVLGKYNLDQMEKEWKEFILSLKKK